MKTPKLIVIVFVILTMLLVSVFSAASQGDGPKDPTAQLIRQTGGRAEIALHQETGRVRFIGTDLDHPIPVTDQLAADAGPEVVARAFLGEYGQLFGLADPAQELQLKELSTAEGDLSYVRFQQVYQGIPVIAGELIVETTPKRQVLSASGEIVPALDLVTTPAITAEAAAQAAAASVAKGTGLMPADLVVSTPELRIFNPATLGGPGMRVSRLVWEMEVTATRLLPIRQFVLVDAQQGVVALSFNQIDTVINRQTYVASGYGTTNLPGSLARSEGQPNGSDVEVNNAHNFAGDTYNFFYAKHGRDGIDGSGMPIISTVKYCPDATDCPYANAFWNGQQMVYGQTYANADDVVAHELTHGVTEHESGLFYYFQSGAMNEAFSDIWGELVDQSTPDGGTRWLMGESLPIGAIRSMSDPTLWDDPDKMSSPYYNCDTSFRDNGGVHTNSGIANKAAYLMVDGGSFNGKTITPLGADKTIKLWYNAAANRLTSGSDYGDLYNSLQAACTALTASGVVTAADCVQAKNALDAVEMGAQPSGCAVTEAPVCPVGTSPSYIYQNNMETPADGRWASGTIQTGNVWGFPPPAYAIYATSGVMNIWGNDPDVASDSYIAMTTNASIPTGQTTYVRFNHSYQFDSPNYDGGVLEYSTNGGSTWTDAGSLITNNGYKGTLDSAYGNPLGGRQAFTGVSSGYTSSRLTLTALGGQNVRFRFRLGSDTSAGHYGWFIDDFNVYTCAATGPTATPTQTVTPGGPTPTPTRTQTPGTGSKIFLTMIRRDTPPPAPPSNFYSTGDTMVMQGFPAYTGGHYTDMIAGYDNYQNGLTMRPLIKFNVTAAMGHNISSAKLRLYFMTSYDFNGTSKAITAYRLTGAWEEGTVTWNTQPIPAEAYGSLSLVHQGSNTAWGWYEIDVTNLVRGWLNNSLPNYGIMLRGPETTPGYRGFYTRESAYDPVLVLTYTSVAAQDTLAPQAMAPDPLGAPSVFDWLKLSMPTAPAACTGTMDVMCFTQE